ncbi:MAG: hypothetical protein KBT40_02970, partial [bacterium]|nr:hypothetical protein [Candidatus Minthenecus merdequi]
QFNTMENILKFGKSRFQIRLYAFAWAILETRDKEFDAAKIKEQNWIVTIMHAMNFATDVECKVISELVDVLGSKPEVKDELGDIKAALEGKSVIYNNLDPHVLLEERDFLNSKSNKK